MAVAAGAFSFATPTLSVLAAFATLSAFRRIGVTLLGAAVAGGLFAAAQAPLPWLIGPLLFTAAAALCGLPVQSGGPLRQVGLWVIGTTLGLTFTPDASQVVWQMAPAIALSVAWALLSGYLFYRFLCWFNALTTPSLQAGAFFASAIGGASEMALLAERAGGPVDRVAAAHSLRVLLVVTCIPLAYRVLGVHGLGAIEVATPTPFAWPGFIGLCLATAVGVALLSVLRGPNPWVLGSLGVAMALTASGQQWSSFPPVLAKAGQLFIGVALGVRFTPEFARTAPRWLWGVALGSVGLMLLAVPAALGLAALFGQPPATVFLGVSPGGIAEMCLTAQALGLGVPVVTAFQVARYVGVMVLMPGLWRFERRRLVRQEGFKS